MKRIGMTAVWAVVLGLCFGEGALLHASGGPVTQQTDFSGFSEVEDLIRKIDRLSEQKRRELILFQSSGTDSAGAAVEEMPDSRPAVLQLAQADAQGGTVVETEVSVTVEKDLSDKGEAPAPRKPVVNFTHRPAKPSSKDMNPSDEKVSGSTASQASASKEERPEGSADPASGETAPAQEMMPAQTAASQSSSGSSLKEMELLQEDLDSLDSTLEEMSRPGEEQVQPQEEYPWNTDIRLQTIEDLSAGMKIDQSFLEAKQIPDEEPSAHPPAKTQEEPPAGILTAQEIIRSVLKPSDLFQKIDLDFDETNLNDVILLLSETSGVNMVLDPSLRNNKFDVHLKDVPVDEALQLIANSYDLGFKKVGHSLYITKTDKLKEQQEISKVIRLKNIDAGTVEDLIRDMIDSVNVAGDMNSIVVMGQPEDILEVQKTIALIDRPQPQVVLEAKIVEVNKDALEELGVDWSDSITLNYQESNRPVDFENIEDSPDSVLKLFQFSRNPVQFSTMIKMLESQNKAKVLSNPRITTMNNKEAEIFVGDRIPYTITTVTGGVATTEVRFEEPGIRLAITPSIIEDDFVVLKVEPEVSFIFAFRGPDDEYPWVKKREATAYVRVKNHQVFALGGLLNQEDKKNLYKVPFFGNVPLLGNLFSYEKNTVLDTELIITITPTIVHGKE